MTSSIQDPRIESLKWNEQVDLAPMTSMGLRCVADAVAVANSTEALGAFLRIATENQWPWFLLGGGSNTIFGSSRYNGIILRLGRSFAKVEPADACALYAGAAAPLSALVRKAAELSLTGLEFCVGIPGQVGGALWGNAGQRGYSICPLVEQVEGFTPSGEAVLLRRGQFEFGYRHSALAQFVLAYARFVLKTCDSFDIRNTLKEFLAVRKEQPLGFRSSGCIFKNPEGNSAGRLIDAAGLKGCKIGGAEVSQQHANFIINLDDASHRDVLALIDHVRATVEKQFGVELQLEVQIVR